MIKIDRIKIPAATKVFFVRLKPLFNVFDYKRDLWRFETLKAKLFFSKNGKTMLNSILLTIKFYNHLI